ncbi:MAG: hypothetical protein ACLTU2_10735 [Mediterraneibacter gnavus]
MQIGLECFMDEQLSSMIASEARYGDCEIQQKTNCIIYDTEEDHYLEEYLYKNYICLFNYLFISSQMSAKPYFIGSTGILLLW